MSLPLALSALKSSAFQLSSASIFPWESIPVERGFPFYLRASSFRPSFFLTPLPRACPVLPLHSCSVETFQVWNASSWREVVKTILESSRFLCHSFVLSHFVPYFLEVLKNARLDGAADCPLCGAISCLPLVSVSSWSRFPMSNGFASVSVMTGGAIRYVVVKYVSPVISFHAWWFSTDGA